MKFHPLVTEIFLNLIDFHYSSNVDILGNINYQTDFVFAFLCSNAIVYYCKFKSYA